MKLSLLTFLAVAMVSGCSRNAYEEEYDLEIDGSGEVQINGVQELVLALNVPGPPNKSLPNAKDVVRRRFDSPELHVLEVGQSTHEGRSFLHVRARFDDLNQLADHPVLSHRQFLLDDSREHLELTAHIPRGLGPRTDRNTLLKEGWIVFRVHLPSHILSHNSLLGIERGNILSWKESLEEFDREGLIHLEVRFAKRTIFEETLFLLGAAIALVILLVAGAIFVIYRMGRRQLASDT